MYGCKSWTIKKAECRSIDAFEVWCWRRLLRVPWTTRRFNQSIQRKSVLNIHWKDWYWSWNSNTLATWSELTHFKRPWCWKRLKVGEEGDDRGWDGWMASLTRWAWIWLNSGCWCWTGKPGVLQSVGSQRVGHDWVTELNWYCISESGFGAQCLVVYWTLQQGWNWPDRFNYSCTNSEGLREWRQEVWL